MNRDEFGYTSAIHADACLAVFHGNYRIRGAADVWSLLRDGEELWKQGRFVQARAVLRRGLFKAARRSGFGTRAARRMASRAGVDRYAESVTS